MENQSKVVVVERYKFAALVKYFQSRLFEASFCKHCAKAVIPVCWQVGNLPACHTQKKELLDFTCLGSSLR